MATAKVLRRWNELTDFIRMLAWTGFAKNGRPQSLFMLAEPGEGKTELLERFRANPHLSFYSDLTMRTVITALRDVQRGKVTHVVVTEFQKVIARRKNVAGSTLAILLQAMEEGVFRVGFGPQEHNLGGSRLGILAATTVTSMRQNPYLVTELAMDSRAYFIDASGSRAELMEIERRIAAGDTSALRPVIMRMPSRAVDVIIPESLGTKVRHWVREMEQAKIRTYGVRTYTRFLHTLRGCALMNGRTKVNTADLEQLYAFRRFWLEPSPALFDLYNSNTDIDRNGDR